MGLRELIKLAQSGNAIPAYNPGRLTPASVNIYDRSRKRALDTERKANALAQRVAKDGRPGVQAGQPAAHAGNENERLGAEAVNEAYRHNDLPYLFNETVKF